MHGQRPQGFTQAQAQGSSKVARAHNAVLSSRMPRRAGPRAREEVARLVQAVHAQQVEHQAVARGELRRERLGAGGDDGVRRLGTLKPGGARTCNVRDSKARGASGGGGVRCGAASCGDGNAPPPRPPACKRVLCARESQASAACTHGARAHPAASQTQARSRTAARRPATGAALHAAHAISSHRALPRAARAAHRPCTMTHAPCVS